jgi:hypothetical protein
MFLKIKGKSNARAYVYEQQTTTSNPTRGRSARRRRKPIWHRLFIPTISRYTNKSLVPPFSDTGSARPSRVTSLQRDTTLSGVTTGSAVDKRVSILASTESNEHMRDARRGCGEALCLSAFSWADSFEASATRKGECVGEGRGKRKSFVCRRLWGGGTMVIVGGVWYAKRLGMGVANDMPHPHTRSKTAETK